MMAYVMGLGVVRILQKGREFTWFEMDINFSASLCWGFCLKLINFTTV